MAKVVVSTDAAPAAIGPYSQAIRSGNLLYMSGQIPLNPAGEFVGGDVEAQTRQVLENVGAVLRSAGLTYNDVIKTTIFLSSMDHFAAVNKVYAEFFETQPPARSTVAVAGLPRGVDVEIECLASFA